MGYTFANVWVNRERQWEMIFLVFGGFAFLPFLDLRRGYEASLSPEPSE